MTVANTVEGTEDTVGQSRRGPVLEGHGLTREHVVNGGYWARLDKSRNKLNSLPILSELRVLFYFC